MPNTKIKRRIQNYVGKTVQWKAPNPNPFILTGTTVTGTVESQELILIVKDSHGFTQRLNAANVNIVSAPSTPQGE